MIPEGWKLVPIKMTREMWIAAQGRIDKQEAWKAALAVAPTPPAQDNPWQQAVLNECFAIEGCYKEADPAGTLTCLINWHVLNERDHAPAQEGSVKIPTSPEEAELMAKLGMTWLQQNAPERLKLPAQDGKS